MEDSRNEVQSTLTFDDVIESSSDQLSIDSNQQSRKRRKTKAGCLHCLQYVSYTNYASSPMISHLLRRHGITEHSPARTANTDFATPLMNSYFQRLPSIHFSPEELENLTVDMIIECKLPFTIVEKPSFRRLLNYTRLSSHAIINVSSADTIRNRIYRLFDVKFGEVKRILATQDWISYTTDVWTSPWKVPYLGITAYWIDNDWKKEEVLIAFSPVLGSHSGDNLATIFVDALQNLDLLGSVFAITTDNASNMIKMVEKVEELIRQSDHFHSQARIYRMFCVGHVLNLAVQDILKVGIGSGPVDHTVDMTTDSSSKKPVNKLRQCVVWIRSSPQNKERFKRCCQSLDLPELQLDLDIRTRWNSTYEMIKKATSLRLAVDQMMAGGPEHMRLSSEDWSFLNVAMIILEPFDQFTKLNSASRYATVNLVTVSYDSLRNALHTIQNVLASVPTANTEDFKIGVNAAIIKLDKYFSGSWNGLLLATATALDPRTKFGFWEAASFQQQDANAAKEMARRAWQDFQPSVTPPPTDSARTLFRQGIINEDEFTDYIVERRSPATDTFDVQQYWKMAESAYPNLSKLARGHLAVCASSTPSERAFSQARLFVPHLRNRLKPDSFRTSMLLWSMKSLLDAEDI